MKKPDEVALGPEYAGSRISRAALEDDESASEIFDGDQADEGDSIEEEDVVDPDTVDLDAEDDDGEIDSDAALGESDAEKFKDFAFRGSSKPRVVNGVKAKRMSAADFMSDSDEDAAIDEAQLDSASDEDEDEDEDMAEREDGEDSELNDDLEDDSVSESDEDTEAEDEEEDGTTKTANKLNKLDLKAMLAQDRKAVVTSISKAATADAEKGSAVKKQRKTFDSLLNIRIRLQKALVATNSMMAADDKENQPSPPYQAAEEAAVKLFNSLTAMRQKLDKAGSVKAGSKRKRDIETSTASSKIWDTLQASEMDSMKLRQDTLEKWSAKVRGATAPETRKLGTTSQPTVVQLLQDQLVDSERLLKRTRTPRSCAPLQAKLKLSEDASIYDDADFYQLLLKELVDQRMVDTAAAPGLQANGRPVAQWTAVKEAKTKKHVDTKASKGRKLKFTVHEKLQNFMAPEDRTSWEQDAIDRFFGTLLGQRMNLGEDVEVSDDEGGAELAEEEALMLFRS